MHHEEIYKVKDGKETTILTGYKLRASGRNPKTGKPKVYPKTFKIPKNIKGKKEQDRWLEKIKLEWQDEVDKITKGLVSHDGNTSFIAVAEKFGDDLYNRDGAFTYYEKWKDAMPLFREHLSVYKIGEINKQIIKNFFKVISKRTFIKRTIRARRSINELNQQEEGLYDMLKVKVGGEDPAAINKIWRRGQGAGVEKIANTLGMNRLTLRLANTPGQTVSKETAETICKHFKVPMDKYFEIVEEEVLYSEATNGGIRSVLSAIFSAAVEDEVIDSNPCLQLTKKEKQQCLTGRKSVEKDVYNIEETQEFIKHTLALTDLRKKVVFLLYITKGIRPCESMGLEWKDFDFSNKAFRILRNSVDTSTFGTRTKGTKTKKSTRILPLDDELIAVLLEYKKWWLEEQAKNGDRWQVGIDRLFVNAKGKPMARNTPAGWVREFEVDHGLKHIPPHSLRHSNITVKLLSGIDPLTVAGDAGHRDASLVLERYGHYVPAESRKAANKMSNVFFNKVKQEEI